MALMGDRYIGTFEGHTIELVRNNWIKTLSLRIDGKLAARGSCMWPWRITLTGTLEHDGIPHIVVARSIPRKFLWTTDTVEVDGRALALTKKY
jgi:hypothetical protein